MPAPKSPNTEPARLALAAKREAERKEREILAAADLLRANGHVVLGPEQIEWIRSHSDESVGAYMRGFMLGV